MLAFNPNPWLALVVGSCLIASCSASGPPAAPTQDTPAAAFDTFMPPNVQLPVAVTAGTCPATVDLWELGLGFEGGADHTVAIDFPAIATGPTEILHSEERRIIYVAPLQDEFAACVGTADSEALIMYSFHFGNGKVHFDLDLTEGNGSHTIRYADLSVNRPYVYWRAEE
ncbi:hypothetical protein PGN35_004365 [Nodosilinea sp. PGN35]|uniref:hypothetical protein n=1 Tax=Nodosilinea sp. PGN35 TaxID=3020489 RepID=UPI0023B2921E|nr:hypothetical protein [Nodosilinea sp. TSF1-S3]MDF0365855.1 hypothetical protein [Nodosilinea sp. TSF1-S3]